jgi:hypothetical protein
MLIKKIVHMCYMYPGVYTHVLQICTITSFICTTCLCHCHCHSPRQMPLSSKIHPKLLIARDKTSCASSLHRSPLVVIFVAQEITIFYPQLSP